MEGHMGQRPIPRIQPGTLSALFAHSEDLRAQSETLQHEANRLSEHIRALDNESARIVKTSEWMHVGTTNGLVRKA